jgi:hypothetical protein
MTDVSCSFTSSLVQGAPTGTIRLIDCNPSIANTETMSSFQVIAIVALLVVTGLILQYVMHHINRKALRAVWQSDTVPGQ